MAYEIDSQTFDLISFLWTARSLQATGFEDERNFIELKINKRTNKSIKNAMFFNGSNFISLWEDINWDVIDSSLRAPKRLFVSL